MSSSSMDTQPKTVQSRISQLQKWFSDRLEIEKLRISFHFVAFICVCFFFSGIYAQFKPKTPHHRVQSVLCAFLLMVYLMAYFYSPRKIQKISGMYTKILSWDKKLWFRCLKLSVSLMLYTFGIENYPYLFSVCSCSFSGFSLCMLKFYGVDFDNYGLCEDFIVALFVPFFDNSANFSLHKFFGWSVVKKHVVDLTLFESYGDRYIYAGIFFAAFVLAFITRYSPDLNPMEERSAADKMEGGVLSDLVHLQSCIDAANEEILSLGATRDAMKEGVQSLGATMVDLKGEIQSLEAIKTAVQGEVQSLESRKEVVVQYLQARKKTLVQTFEEAGKQISEITDSLLNIASSSSSGVVNENPFLEPEKEVVPEVSEKENEVELEVSETEKEEEVELEVSEKEEELAPEVQVDAMRQQMRAALMLIASSSVRGVIDIWTEIMEGA